MTGWAPPSKANAGCFTFSAHESEATAPAENQYYDKLQNYRSGFSFWNFLSSLGARMLSSPATQHMLLKLPLTATNSVELSPWYPRNFTPSSLFLSHRYNIELVCYGVIITGVIILLVGAVGWYAGLTSSIRVCRIYCVLILIIILLQAAFAVVGN